MSTGNISWGGSRSIEGQRSWQASGSGEVQMHRPMAENKEVQQATNRTVNASLDAFQNVKGNLFGAASHLFQAAASGRPINTAEVMAAARFKPAEFANDIRKVASELSRNPVDTIQNMMLGAPTGAIDKALKGADGTLRSLEEATGLKKEFKGSVQKQFGDFREYQARKQIGDLGTLTNTTQTKVGGDFGAQGTAKVGLAGAEAQGSFQGSLGASVESRSRYEGALGTATNTSRAFADATYGGQGSVKAGISGLDAQGSIGARAGAGVSTQGRLENGLGQVNYEARAGVEAYANANGTAKVDATGAQAHLRGEIGVSASAEAKADFKTAGIKLGGEDLDIRGQGKVRVTAEAKAEGYADVAATINPPRIGGEIGGKAFAGVKAEAEGKIGIGEFANIHGQVGAWAGAGAEGKVVFGYDDGKLRFGFGGGAAIGYGAGGSWGVEVDVKKIANAAIGTGLQVASKGIEYALNPSAIGRDVAKTAQNIEKTVSHVADTANKVVSTATQAAKSVVDGAKNAINNVINKFKLW